MRNAHTHAPLVRVSLAILSGVLLAFSFPPFGTSVLAWWAIVPLLFAIEGRRARESFWLGFLAGLVFAAGRVGWFVFIFGPVAVGLLAVLAFWDGVFCALFSSAQRRWGIVGAALLCPVLWVGIEFFSGECYPLKFTWLCLGYSQAPNSITRQFASLLGMYGLSFVIVGASAALWAGLRRPRRTSRVIVGTACAAALIALPYAWGMASRTPKGQKTVRVAAVQCGPGMLGTFERLTRKAAAGGARLIVWPECAVFSKLLQDKQTLQRLRRLCRQTGAALVIGCKTQAPLSPSSFYNAAIILDPDGKLLGEYRKNVPIQFFNDGLPGRYTPAFATPVGRLAIAICYDMGYPYILRRAVRDGAEVIVVPTHDPPRWGPEQRIHASLTPMRAVELRRWVVRPSLFGISEIVDPWGRVVRISKGDRPQVLLADVETIDTRTVYTQGGWLLAPLCLLITALVLLAFCLPRRRERSCLKRVTE